MIPLRPHFTEEHLQIFVSMPEDPTPLRGFPVFVYQSVAIGILGEATICWLI